MLQPLRDTTEFDMVCFEVVGVLFCFRASPAELVNCTLVHLFHAEMRFDNLRKLKIKYFSIMFLPHYAFTDLSLDPLGRLISPVPS